MMIAAADTNSVIYKIRNFVESNQELIAQKTIEYGPKVLTAVAMLVVGLFIGSWLAKVTMRQLLKRDLEPPVRMVLIRLVKLFVLVLTLLLIADNLEIKLLPLIAGLGVAGVGIGLAMQGVLSNLVAGLTIIFVKPFRVGEYIAIAGVEGQVDTIELFSTRLLHADRSQVVIPNRKIVGEIIHNYGKIRQLDLSVGVGYDTDLNRALDIVRDILSHNPRVLKDPVPAVGTATLADSSIIVAIKPWTALADFGPAQGEINKAVIERFREAGISIPFPQREIRLLPGADIKSVA